MNRGDGGIWYIHANRLSPMRTRCIASEINLRPPTLQHPIILCAFVSLCWKRISRSKNVLVLFVFQIFSLYLQHLSGFSCPVGWCPCCSRLPLAETGGATSWEISVVDAWYSDALKLRTLHCHIRKPCSDDAHGYVISIPFWCSFPLKSSWKAYLSHIGVGSRFSFRFDG